MAATLGERRGSSKARISAATWLPDRPASSRPGVRLGFADGGHQVWRRTRPDGKLAVYATRDGGSSWKRQDGGLPAEHA